MKEETKMISGSGAAKVSARSEQTVQAFQSGAHRLYAAVLNMRRVTETRRILNVKR